MSSINKSFYITWYPVSQGYFQISPIVFFNRIIIQNTANIVKNWIHNIIRNILVLPLPSQSPDLNPIKNLLAFLDKKLKTRQCMNKDDLLQYLQEGWKSLSPDILTNLVASMPNRCRELIKNKGNPIKYWDVIKCISRLDF